MILPGVGSHAIDVGLYRSMPYDPAKDFAHVTLIASGPNPIAVNPAFAPKTLPDLVALVKKEPGKFSYASSGRGSSGDVATELFKQKAGLAIEHIPYRGGSPAMTDVTRGQVPVLVTNADAEAPHVKDNRLRILVVTSAGRSALYPARRRSPSWATPTWSRCPGRASRRRRARRRPSPGGCGTGSPRRCRARSRSN